MPDEFEPYLIPEFCQFCNKRPVYYAGHGIRKGELYNEFSCIQCFAKKNNVSKEKTKRLKSESAESAENIESAESAEEVIVAIKIVKADPISKPIPLPVVPEIAEEFKLSRLPLSFKEKKT